MTPLTQTGGGQHPRGHVGRNTVGEDGLQDVAGESERDDGQRGRIHDEDGAPQQEKPGRERDISQHQASSACQPCSQKSTSGLFECKAPPMFSIPDFSGAVLQD